MVEKWNYDFNNHHLHNSFRNKTPNQMMDSLEDKNSTFGWSEK
jgi:hypothetical protein